MMMIRRGISLTVVGFIASAAYGMPCASQALRSLEPGVLYPQSGEPFVDRATIVQHDDETSIDLGVNRFTLSTIELMRKVPARAIQINAEGQIVAFAPALPPAEGVADYPRGVGLKYVKFDAAGRLNGWELANEMIVPCLTWSNPETGLLFCTAPNCPSPKICVLTWIEDPVTHEVTVQYLCEDPPN